MYEEIVIPFRRALEAELTVRCHGVVHEDDAVAETAVVQNLAVVLAQLARLRLKAELVLERERENIAI